MLTNPRVASEVIRDLFGRDMTFAAVEEKLERAIFTGRYEDLPVEKPKTPEDRLAATLNEVAELVLLLPTDGTPLSPELKRRRRSLLGRAKADLAKYGITLTRPQ